jgi:hypothetical protein
MERFAERITARANNILVVFGQCIRGVMKSSAVLVERQEVAIWYDKSARNLAIKRWGEGSKKSMKQACRLYSEEGRQIVRWSHLCKFLVYSRRLCWSLINMHPGYLTDRFSMRWWVRTFLWNLRPCPFYMFQFVHFRRVPVLSYCSLPLLDVHLLFQSSQKPLSSFSAYLEDKGGE